MWGWVLVVASAQTFPVSTNGTSPPPPPGATVIRQQQPQYPTEARLRGQHGRVVVIAVVDETGKVVEAKVDESARQPCAGEIIEAAAIEAATRSTFTPAEMDGRPIRAATHLFFTFAPTISIDLTAPAEIALGDSVQVVAVISSDVRLDQVEVGITFPVDPYGSLAPPQVVSVDGNEGSFPRREGRMSWFATKLDRRKWNVTLFPGSPLTVEARFAAMACGTDSIGAFCIDACHPEAMTSTVPVCIRGYPGSHFEEYRAHLAHGDTTTRAFRVDSKVLAQQEDPCCVNR
jgi:TonB family protein